MGHVLKTLSRSAFGTLSYVLALMVAFAFFIASGFVSVPLWPVALVVGTLAWLTGGFLESKIV
jgi:hypothetical protein